MKRLAMLLAGSVGLAVSAGCLEMNILWSPDGQHALIRGEDRLYLCDRDGKLSEATTQPAEAMAWCPDSRHAIMQRPFEVKTWDDAKRCRSPKEIELVAAKAAEVLRLARNSPPEANVLNTYDGGGGVGWDVILYLRQNHDAEMQAALGERWHARRDAGFETFAFQLCSIVDGRLKPDADLALFAHPASNIRVSPNGKAYAFTRQEDRDGPAALWVGAVDQPGALEQVCYRAGRSFDWTGDSSGLVYLVASADADRAPLSATGTLLVHQVVDDRGMPLPRPQSGSPTKTRVTALAMVVFDVRSGIACLPDGRVLFATPEVKFPSTQGDQPESMSLYVADPSGRKPLQRLLRREIDRGLPRPVPYFQLSPGGKSVLIPNDDGPHVVIDLAGGQKPTTLPDAEGRDVQLRTLPVWQSADTVCYFVSSGFEKGPKDRPELVLATRQANGQWAVKVISRDWPEDLVRRLAQ